MEKKLNPRLSSSDWKEFCERFHFPAEKVQYIQIIYTALLPLVDSYVYYSLAQDMDEILFTNYAYGIITLGTGVDELSELYLNHEQLEEAYIVDCISLMLLSKAYEEVAHLTEQETGLHLAELSFLGDTYSMDLLPKIYHKLKPASIRLTDGLMLWPLKTATLILRLDTKAASNRDQLCNSCAGCKNYSCPSRKEPPLELPLTYGAMQIFHRKLHT